MRCDTHRDAERVGEEACRVWVSLGTLPLLTQGAKRGRNTLRHHLNKSPAASRERIFQPLLALQSAATAVVGCVCVCVTSRAHVYT